MPGHSIVEKNLWGVDQEVITPPSSEEMETCIECDGSFRLRDMFLEPYPTIPSKTEQVFLCADCWIDKYTVCEGCQHAISVEDINRIGTPASAMCDACMNIHYFYCQNCEEHILYTYRSANPDYPECNNCYGARTAHRYADEPATNVLNAQRWANLPRIGNPEDKLFMGVELEVELSLEKSHVQDSAANDVERLLRGYVIIKTDGSLKRGIEIVTVPCEFSEHYKRMNLFFDHIKRLKEEYGMKSFDTTTCGMHIHFSREAVGETHMAKIMCFLHSPLNEKFVQTVAGRSKNNYCNYVPKTFEQAKMEYHHLSPSRYQALNISSKSTGEVRIFKGTLKRESFFKNLEFVHALIHFTKAPARTLENAMDYNKFLEWLIDNKERSKQYGNLIAFLAEKKIITQKGEKYLCALSLKKRAIMLSKKIRYAGGRRVTATAGG